MFVMFLSRFELAITYHLHQKLATLFFNHSSNSRLVWKSDLGLDDEEKTIKFTYNC